MIHFILVVVYYFYLKTVNFVRNMKANFHALNSKMYCAVPVYVVLSFVVSHKY